ALDPAPDRLDLPLVKQKLARSLRLVAERGAGEDGDIHALEPGLVVLDGAPRVAEIGRTDAKDLHFAPPENEPRLEPLAELVVEAGAPVLDDELIAARLLCLGHALPLPRPSARVHDSLARGVETPPSDRLPYPSPCIPSGSAAPERTT